MTVWPEVSILRLIEADGWRKCDFGAFKGIATENRSWPKLKEQPVAINCCWWMYQIVSNGEAMVNIVHRMKLLHNLNQTHSSWQLTASNVLEVFFYENALYKSTFDILVTTFNQPPILICHLRSSPIHHFCFASSLKRFRYASARRPLDWVDCIQ